VIPDGAVETREMLKSQRDFGVRHLERLLLASWLKAGGEGSDLPAGLYLGSLASGQTERRRFPSPRYEL
jgi:hypothetical protein